MAANLGFGYGKRQWEWGRWRDRNGACLGRPTVAPLGQMFFIPN